MEEEGRWSLSKDRRVGDLMKHNAKLLQGPDTDRKGRTAVGKEHQKRRCFFPSDQNI